MERVLNKSNGAVARFSRGLPVFGRARLDTVREVPRKNVGEMNRGRRRNAVLLVCDECGEEFTVPASVADAGVDSARAPVLMQGIPTANYIGVRNRLCVSNRSADEGRCWNIGL